MVLPQGEEFRNIVEELRDEPELGGRLARAEYDERIRERDREWLDEGNEESGMQDRWEKKYAEERSQWHA
jgi:hypothetical protein